ncbi:hypothetical protein [Spiroplasma endosymbiont of Polydrusus pterygomalis]
MKNDNFKFLNDKELLRLTGIKQNTFNKMLNIRLLAMIIIVSQEV